MDESETNTFIVPIGILSALIFVCTSYNHLNQFQPFEPNLLHLWTNLDTAAAAYGDSAALTAYCSLMTLFGLAFSYFVADFMLMILHFKRDYLEYFLHHSIAIIGIAISFHNIELAKYTLAYLTYEISTIFLNLWTVRKRQGQRDSTTALMLGLFTLTFIIIRICFGSWITYSLLMKLNHAKLLQLSVIPLALQFMNYLWFYKIIKMWKRGASGIPVVEPAAKDQ